MNFYIPLETALELLVTAYVISITVPLATSVAGMAVIEVLEATNRP